MPTTERSYGVWLNTRRVGTLNQRGDYTWFGFSEEYLADSHRAVLGLIFEQDPSAQHASALRLPPWFSNLLPEGRLRDWIAADRRVSVEREMELLAQVGHDLPGAVQVLPEDEPPKDTWDPSTATADPYAGNTGADWHHQGGWRFSLAGVGLKFSMLRKGDRLTLPAFGEGGDWIVKLPDPAYPDVPRNEFAMMTLAAHAGIEVPDRLLVHRDQLDGLPSQVWAGREEYAYAVRRFDRDDDRSRVHIEDLAQVRNFYADQKYAGTFETIASLVYRRHDLAALREFARRLAFNVLITNGDAHLKNWSLIYRDPVVPTLSPAYDMVSTGLYRIDDLPENLGLKFCRSRRLDLVNTGSFDRLQRRLAVVDAELSSVVAEMVARAVSGWPDVAQSLTGAPLVLAGIEESIASRAVTLLRT